MQKYAEFLAAKAIVDKPSGLVDVPDLNPQLFPFQRDIVRWALRRGRAAIFADCGLGKTPMQLEWARHVPGQVLIFAPLAVAQQTAREGAKFGVQVRVAREAADVTADCKVWITNYEMMHKFTPGQWGGVVLDESSILKDHTAKTRAAAIAFVRAVPYRICCTATPAPNDYMELGNHAECLGVMTYTEMLSRFFFHDGGETSKWTLKGHAESDFWRWLASWAVAIRKPSDLGYEDGGYCLPEIHYHEHIIPAESPMDGMLLAIEAQTMDERRRARKSTVCARVAMAAQVIANHRPALAWCNLNDESQQLTAAIADATEITGSDAPEVKTERMIGFTDGKYPAVVSKPSICGHGMNWQHCNTMVFVGLSDSYEEFYQAVRRCYRFGQARPVHVHIVVSEMEGSVLANVKRKQQEAESMMQNIVSHMADITRTELRGSGRNASKYERDEAHGDNWTMMLGDCVEGTAELPSDSIGYSIFSPPFSSLYTYSDQDRDMGNSANDDEFYQHMRFLVQELYRVTMPGRLLSFHCMDLPTTKTRDGFIGLRDFRGELLALFQEFGWIYHSGVTIWKDPVTAMQRTKAIGLLHKQVCKDSAMSRQGIPDYLITMRKPGDNPAPVAGDLARKLTGAGMDIGKVCKELNAVNGHNMSINLWQIYASPVWMDVNPSRTLQKESAREEKDERHICPLQLDVIERGIVLWSNPGDVVLSPFGGIGSEGYMAVKMNRKYHGIELKRSYWTQACLNLRRAESEQAQENLFTRESVSEFM